MIQVVHHGFYINIAKHQYQVVQTVPAVRGLIVDRHDTHACALNREMLSAFILPNQLQQPRELSEFLKQHFPQAHKRLEQTHKSSFMFIKRKLTPEQQQCIEFSGLTDIKLLKEPSRYYPLRCMAHIVGMTDIDNKGQFGLELYYNDRLTGVPHISVLEKDARSGHFYFEKMTKSVGIEGEQLRITIDSDLQFVINQELEEWIKQFEAKQGAVVVMDPVTGDILAMVSAPGFDPNDAADLAVESTKNIPIADAHELGSVFKVFTALAALDERVVAPDDLIDCKNVATTYINGRRVNTVPGSVRGIVPFWEVIAISNNIGISLVAQELQEKLYNHYVQLGFGQKIGIQLPGEHAGFVNHPRNWSRQSLFSLSYGYEITATLLQLARAFSVFANDGYLVSPRIILEPATQTDLPKKLYTHQTIEAMRSILELTTTQGTAKRARVKGYKVLSKTGTANALVNGVYDSTKNLYTCAGIVERDNYKRVIVTFIKEAKAKNLYASTVAAPLFERVAEKVLIHQKII